MKNKFIAFFIPHEEEYSFDIALKSKTLLIFSFIFITILPVLWLLLIAVQGYSIISILSLAIMIIIISNIASLFILRTGRYYAAANTFVSLSCRVQLFPPLRNPHIRHRYHNFRIPAFSFYNFLYPLLQKKNDTHYSFFRCNYTSCSSFILP